MEISSLDRTLPKSKNLDKEVNEFTNELSKSLNKDKNKKKKKEIKLKREPTIYEDLLANDPLAKKFKSKLKEIIKGILIEYSYKSDFYYLEQKKDKYYLVYCNEENFDKYEVKPEDIKKYGYTVGMFYEEIPEGFVESSVKEGIKSDVQMWLYGLDTEKKK